MKYLSEEHFNQVIELVRDQVFKGKGNERHGHHQPLEDQPWAFISKNVGSGFVVGQALKKLLELKSFSSLSAWEREAIGAIVYTIMGIMYKQYENFLNSGDQGESIGVAGNKFPGMIFDTPQPISIPFIHDAPPWQPPIAPNLPDPKYKVTHHCNDNICGESNVEPSEYIDPFECGARHPESKSLDKWKGL